MYREGLSLPKIFNMRCFFIFIIYCFLGNVVEGQDQFLQEVDFGRFGLKIFAFDIDNDTLILTGITSPEEPPYVQVLFIAKMDTTGLLLDFVDYREKNGGNYALDSEYFRDILVLEDSYILLNGVFEESSGRLIKANKDLTIQWEKSYPDTNTFVDIFKAVIETPDGFLIGGRKQLLDFHSQFFLIKIDREGNQIWQKYYGSPNHDEHLRGIIKAKDKGYILHGNTVSHGPQLTQVNSSFVFHVDDDGNVLDEWYSQQSLEELWCDDLHQDEKGNWIYTSGRGKFEFDGFFQMQPKFIIRDSNFNLITEKVYNDTIGFDNKFIDMIPMSSGGWLAVGKTFLNSTEPPHRGWMVRLDEQGDTIWTRSDIAIENDTMTSRINELIAAVELPSGSIIAAGNCVTLQPGKNWGWIIKVDKNGCIDTLLCHPTVNLKEHKPKEPIRVFPNPTSQNVTFSFSSSSNKQLIINDLSGRVIAEAMIPSYQNQYVWSSENHPPGVYFYQVFSGREKIQSGKIVVQR